MTKFFSTRLLSFLIAPAILLSVASMPDRVNFSGEWKLNEGKSELGDFGGRVARTIKAEQKDDAITIAKTSPGFNGGDPVTTTQTLTFDGKESEIAVFNGAGKRKSTAKWSDDGQTLTINSVTTIERDGQTTEFKGTETWTLTKEGSLSVITVSSSPRGENTTKAIYDK